MVALLKLYRPSLDCLQLENKGEKTQNHSAESPSVPSEQVFNLASLACSLSFQWSFDRRLMRTIFLHIWFLFPSVAEVIKGRTFGWVRKDNGINDFICGLDDVLTSITFNRNYDSCSLWPFSPYRHLLVPTQEVLCQLPQICVSTFGYCESTSPWVLCFIDK